jgi:trehalose 6-phosphate phosphatase
VTAPTSAHAPLLARLQGAPLVLMLDVDGTLAPIAARPEDAAVPPETRAVVAALASAPGVAVALVSGRGAADALRLVGIDGLAAAGNHGFELVTAAGGSRPHPAAAPYAGALAGAVADLRAALHGVEGALVEDKGLTISVHYRLVAEGERPRVEEAAHAAARAHGLHAGDGKLIVELRPPVAIDKGTAVLALASELGGSAPGASLLFAGDDVTDEDAFVSLRAHDPAAVTVHVGSRPDTAAEFRVPDAPAFADLLREIAAARAPAPPR